MLYYQGLDFTYIRNWCLQVLQLPLTAIVNTRFEFKILWKSNFFELNWILNSFTDSSSTIPSQFPFSTWTLAVPVYITIHRQTLWCTVGSAILIFQKCTCIICGRCCVAILLWIEQKMKEEISLKSWISKGLWWKLQICSTYD